MQHVAHVNQVLRGHGFVEPVLDLEIFFICAVAALFCASEIAGHGVHRNERGGCDEPDRNDALDQALDRVTEHSLLCVTARSRHHRLPSMYALV